MKMKSKIKKDICIFRKVDEISQKEIKDDEEMEPCASNLYEYLEKYEKIYNINQKKKKKTQ